MTVNRGQVELNADTLNTDPNGYNSWNISIKEPGIYHSSCSVTNPDLPISIDSDIEKNETPETAPENGDKMMSDTGFLKWTGRALTANGGKLSKNNSLMVMLVKDSTVLMSRTVQLDAEGRFSLGSLFFFGNAELLFQLNTIGAGSKDVKLLKS